MTTAGRRLLIWGFIVYRRGRWAYLHILNDIAPPSPWYRD